jgi:hypothetical protein
MITAEVGHALEALKREFGESLTHAEVGDGGAHVRIPSLTLGPPYAQDESWFAFTLTYLHPYGDIYPIFVRPDLSRLDGRPLTTPIHVNNAFQGQPAVMVSRRTKLLGPGHPIDPVLKILKVRQWMLSQ